MSSARTGLLIRDLRPGDSQDLIDAYYSYYRELADNTAFGLALYRTKPSYGSELEWFSHLYRDFEAGNCVAKVAVVRGRIVGMCNVTRQRPGSETDHVGELGIAVRSGYRNMGIGRKLMASAISACRGRFETIQLSVFAVNYAAIRLYRSVGFVRWGTLPRAVRRGRRYFDQDLMFLDLRG